ncbi:MAG: YjbQ family protein [Candidatus Caldatribacterium sp.]|nr:YjbQ family protein [Candidatus Caldatribacterium sp.]
MVVTREIRLETKGHTDVVPLTEQVAAILKESGLSSGLVCLFLPGTTATLTTTEFEPGLVKDIKDFWERIAPVEHFYEHNARWHDGNGYAHVRAQCSGPSLVLPFVEGKLLLGTWQDIVLVDFDNRPRSRTVIVQIMGE